MLSLAAETRGGEIRASVGPGRSVPPSAAAVRGPKRRWASEARGGSRAGSTDRANEEEKKADGVNKGTTTIEVDTENGGGGGGDGPRAASSFALFFSVPNGGCGGGGGGVGGPTSPECTKKSKTEKKE